MKRIRDRVAGLDVHRDSVMACVRLVEAGEVVEELERFSTTTAGVARLGRWLIDHQVDTVAMEATGVYWKPVYYGLEDMFEELWLCNAAHVKNVPGRKTDLADAAWLADVVAHGMIQPSMVPEPPIRALRELSRYRRTQIDARAAEIQRLEKLLQDACVKISSVASRVWTQSARAMVEALIAGERDPVVLADLAKSRMRSKTAELTEALAAHWGPHHSIVAAEILGHIDHLDASIESLTAGIGERLGPFEHMVAQMVEITGVDRRTAEIVIAETGANMSVFPTPEQITSWGGLAPENHESAGKHHPAGTRKGGRHLRRALIESAKATARTDTFLGAKYRRIARRRGPNKAAVAVARTILIICWHLMSDPELRYEDLGADFYDKRRDPQREAARLSRQIERLGFAVTLEPAA